MCVCVCVCDYFDTDTCEARVSWKSAPWQSRFTKWRKCIYLLTATGLSPDGNTHLHTNNT